MKNSNHAVEHFQWSEVTRGLIDPSTWLSACAYFGILSGLYSFGLFVSTHHFERRIYSHMLIELKLPTIITGLGYTANNAQLWSVIPYAVASVVTGTFLESLHMMWSHLVMSQVIISVISDHLNLRGIIMLFTLLPAIIGYAVIANVHNNKVKYGMTFLMATGLYASVPCVLVWNSNNSAGHYKRATTSALQLAIANCGGFVASMYPTQSVLLMYCIDLLCSIHIPESSRATVS